ncbi:hypothetical protein HYH02_005642 [Chlamydomonas schloesseri]|uniref:SOUL heme-binding protein n=1 Tax=Chlamydomonas schloesseri TaxID=2026947 RepID=A0A836B773_9CHLO|nr:hypothetical protein HYH02_005642 [Chlamydomonas schloesseri]|eukprot:KAG2449498.1 hypothetical protein HYH02_005642 [Chlamydomonas schloesseri]
MTASRSFATRLLPLLAFAACAAALLFTGAALGAKQSAAKGSTTGAAATAIAGAAGDGAGGWSPPAFCRGKDCPEFEVLQTRGDVELRRYKKAHWISTNVTGAKWGDAYDEGYQRLQDYIKGGNVDGRKLPQTNPSFTLVYVSDPRAHALSSTFTIEYFVPFELQDTPPAPTSSDLAVTPVEQQEVWVLSFGGFATEDVVVTRGFDFLANLTGDQVDVATEYFGVALYDQPSRLLNRHNELWVWSKTPSPSSASATTRAKQGAKCGSKGKGKSSSSSSSSSSTAKDNNKEAASAGPFASSFASASSSSRGAAATNGADDVRVVMEQAWQTVGADGQVRGGRSSYDSAAAGAGGGEGSQQGNTDTAGGPGFEDVRRARESLRETMQRMMQRVQAQFT